MKLGSNKRKRIIWIHLYEVLKVIGSHTKSYNSGTRDWGCGIIGVRMFNGSRMSFGRWRVLEMDGDYGCTTTWVYLMLLNHTLKIIPIKSIKWSEVAQSCPTLCDPVNPPGSSVLGLLQARILEWVAISFSNKICPVYFTTIKKKQKIWWA